MRLVASLSPCFFRKFDCSLHLLALCFFCLFSLVSFFLLLSSVHVLGSCIQQRDVSPASPLLFSLVSVSSPFIRLRCLLLFTCLACCFLTPFLALFLCPPFSSSPSLSLPLPLSHSRTLISLYLSGRVLRPARGQASHVAPAHCLRFVTLLVLSLFSFIFLPFSQ